MKTLLKAHLSALLTYKGKIIVLGALLVVFLVFKGALLFTNQASEKPKCVETIVVKKEPISLLTRLIGTIQAKQEVIFSAKAPGHLKIYVLSGTFVKQGTVIAEIEDTELNKQYDLALEKVRIAKVQYERLKMLASKNSASAVDVEKKELEWLEAQRQLAAEKQNLERAHLTAPFDGFLGSYKFREGSYLKRDETIVSLYNPEGQVIEVEISEGILKDLPENPKAWVLGQLLPLSYFQKVIDPETHMASALIELPDSFPKQIIGTAIDVELVVKEYSAALVIPHEALFIQDQKTYVYGVEGKKAVRTLVEVGIRQKDKVEILDGVKENDQIIWRGQNRLYDGIDVEPYDPSKSRFEK